MPKTKNAYLRYLMIHSQIKRNKYKYGYPTIRDLQNYIREEEYDVSLSTLEKDLTSMKYEWHAPLEYNRKERCYRYTEEWDFNIPISPEDIRVMQMLIHKLEIFGEAEEFKMFKESIKKLSDHLNLVRRYPSDSLNKYILFEYSKGFSGKHLLPPFYDAIYDKREITFTHCRYESDVPTRRTIEPYTLKEHRNRWYVIGKENSEPRIFGLDRIQELETTGRHFIQEPEFYDEIFMVLKDAVGVMAFGFETEDVVLQFNREEASYIKSLMLHRSQEIIKDDDEGLTVKLHVKATHEFIMECILRFGEKVRVLEPESLVERVKKIYNTTLYLYKSG